MARYLILSFAWISLILAVVLWFVQPASYQYLALVMISLSLHAISLRLKEMQKQIDRLGK